MLLYQVWSLEARHISDPLTAVASGLLLCRDTCQLIAMLALTRNVEGLLRNLQGRTTDKLMAHLEEYGSLGHLGPLPLPSSDVGVAVAAVGAVAVTADAAVATTANPTAQSVGVEAALGGSPFCGGMGSDEAVQRWHSDGTFAVQRMHSGGRGSSLRRGSTLSATLALAKAQSVGRTAEDPQWMMVQQQAQERREAQQQQVQEAQQQQVQESEWLRQVQEAEQLRQKRGAEQLRLNQEAEQLRQTSDELRKKMPEQQRRGLGQRGLQHSAVLALQQQQQQQQLVRQQELVLRKQLELEQGWQQHRSLSEAASAEGRTAATQPPRPFSPSAGRAASTNVAAQPRPLSLPAGQVQRRPLSPAVRPSLSQQLPPRAFLIPQQQQQLPSKAGAGQQQPGRAGGQWQQQQLPGQGRQAGVNPMQLPGQGRQAGVAQQQLPGQSLQTGVLQMQLQPRRQEQTTGSNRPSGPPGGFGSTARNTGLISKSPLGFTGVSGAQRSCLVPPPASSGAGGDAVTGGAGGGTARELAASTVSCTRFLVMVAGGSGIGRRGTFSGMRLWSPGSVGGGLSRGCGFGPRDQSEGDFLGDAALVPGIRGALLRDAALVPGIRGALLRDAAAVGD